MVTSVVLRTIADASVLDREREKEGEIRMEEEREGQFCR